jgi:hypothetical protein
VERPLSFNHCPWDAWFSADYRRDVAKRKRHGNSGAPPVDPFAVLGLPPDASVAAIETARRTLAKTAHPDVGGSVGQMQLINSAADEATRRASAGTAAPAEAAKPTPAPPAPTPPGPGLHWRVDHPSFTIEALPAASFEALFVVASWLGETIDDDPPYRLDVELAEPVPCWCRLELLPDAGATTVGVTLGSEHGVTAADLDAVRDAWVAALNVLDWEEIGDSRLRP